MKFKVYGTITASKYLGIFEADNEDDAIEMALSDEVNYVSLCFHCSREIEISENYCGKAYAEKIDD